MPRLHPDDFEGRELIPLCLAASIPEGDSIEAALDSIGVEYTIEITEFVCGLFGGVKQGVMFVVLPEDMERSKAALTAAGLGHLIVEE